MDYVKYIRDKVGHDKIILNYSGCVIYNNANQTLLQKRRDCNKWGFMGGVVELGESSAEAAIREVFEESGLIIEIDALLGIYSKYFDEYKNGDKVQTILHMFIAHIVGGQLIEENEETIELRFFDLSDTPEIFNQQHIDILNDIKSGVINVIR